MEEQLSIYQDQRSDKLSYIRRLVHPKSGLYLFFRMQSIRAQQRYAELSDLTNTPSVFLHGNPHIDNYARTNTGCGMIDFDRSRIGPYSWDLVRLLSSLQLRWKDHKASELDERIIQSVHDGYVSRFNAPDLGYETLASLAAVKPEKWQLSTNAYLEANKKWAKKMRENPIDPKDPRLMQLFSGYTESRSKQHHLEIFDIVEAGICSGSFGKPRFLVVLSSRSHQNDKIILDFKEVYQDVDSKFFYNPYRNHGHRMVEASHLYAPGVEQRIGYAQLAGQQYWVRQVPPFQVKLKGNLPTALCEEFGYCVGAQLGIGHRRSLLFTKPEKLMNHFKQEWPRVIELSHKMVKELRRDYKIYCNQVKNQVMDLVEFFEDED